MLNKQLLAILIIVLMVASSIAFTVYYNTPQQQEPEVPPLDQKPTVLRFKAEGIDSEIVQMLPSMRIAASATEPNINEIDKQVSGFQGVKSVSSQFRQNEETELGKGLLYIADVSFSVDTNRQALLVYLEELPSVSNVDALSFALVGIPKQVKLVSEQPDLNLSREHEFTDTVIEAFVSTDANTGDKIKLNLSLALSGNDVSEIIAFQSFDLAPSFEQKQAVLSAPVSFLFPELLVQATIDSAELSDTNAFKAEFLKISDVNGVQLSLPEDFDPNAAVSKPIEIAIKLSLVSSESSATVAGEAEKILKAKSASFSISHPAIVSLSAITDADTNSSFAVPESQFTVFLKPGHSAGETVEIIVDYFVLDKTIVSIQGREKE